MNLVWASFRGSISENHKLHPGDASQPRFPPPPVPAPRQRPPRKWRLLPVQLQELLSHCFLLGLQKTTPSADGASTRFWALEQNLGESWCQGSAARDTRPCSDHCINALFLSCFYFVIALESIKTDAHGYRWDRVRAGREPYCPRKTRRRQWKGWASLCGGTPSSCGWACPRQRTGKKLKPCSGLCPSAAAPASIHWLHSP